MKKYIIILSFLLVLMLSACTNDCTEETCITLPDLDGYTKEELETELLGLNINFTYTFYNGGNPETGDIFVKYIGYEVGDVIAIEDSIVVEIYPAVIDYFEVIDMDYDGPYLDEVFRTINYLVPRGGYFEVTLKSCTDGDTAQFHYPNDVYEAIESNAKSARFLNMDTEETYNGGEEEWGKPASVYTCSLLQNAESIVIQTDPDDALLGTYGRLLSWIWIQLPNEEEYFLLNYMVVKQGLAQVKYEFGAGETISYEGITYNEWMHIAEDYAIENSLAQWGNGIDYYWNYEDNEPFYSRW